MKKVLLFTILLLFFFDRITKLWALSCCIEPFEATNYLTFLLTYNRGVSFSLFSSPDTTLFILVSLFSAFITLLLGIYTYRAWLQNKNITGELLVCVGSCSNLLDRFFYGAVIDFILVHYKTWSFAIFNIADSAIVLGVGIMAYHIFFIQE